MSKTSDAPVSPKLKVGKKKWFLPAIVSACTIFIGGSAYAYFGYFLNTPEQVWNRALGTTAHGYSALATAKPKIKKGLQAEGTFKVTAPLIADGTIHLKADEKNFVLQTDAGTSGIRANLEVRGVASAGTTPDLYLQLSGVKAIASILGLKGNSELGALLTGVEDRWFLVDHTLLDQMINNAGDTGQVSVLTTESPEKLQTDIYTISKKLSGIITNQLLSTNNKKAVVVIKNKLGKEQFNGRTTQHYKVRIQKAQLRATVVALKDTLKDTNLKELLGVGSNKSFESASKYNQIINSIDNADFDNTEADVWIDTGYSVIRNVRLNAIDAKGKHTGTIDLFFDYKGGDELPFTITITSDQKDNNGTIALGVTLNQKTGIVKFLGTVNGTTSGQKIALQADITLQGSDDKVAPERPAGAKNLLDLVAPLLLQLQSKSPPNLIGAPKTR